MYTPRGELDDRILELLDREDLYQRLAACRDAGEIRQTVESLCVIDPETLEESLTVICSYLSEMRMREVLDEGGPEGPDCRVPDPAAVENASDEARACAVLESMQKRKPDFFNRANSLLMNLQE